MKFIVCLLVALGCVNVATSLKCYVCSSPGEKTCVDPFNKDNYAGGTTEIAEGGVCMKTKTDPGQGDTIYARAAVPTTALCVGGTNGCKSASEGGASATVCCCTKDLCNGATMTHQHTFVLFAILSGVLMVVNRLY